MYGETVMPKPKKRARTTLTDLLKKALNETPSKASDWFKTPADKSKFLEGLYKSILKQIDAEAKGVDQTLRRSSPRGS